MNTPARLFQVHHDRALRLLTSFAILAVLLIAGAGATFAAKAMPAAQNIVSSVFAQIDGAQIDDAKTAVRQDDQDDDGRGGDKLDFDEQGIGGGSPPPPLFPMLSLIIDRIPFALINPAPPGLSPSRAGLLAISDPPHFTRVEKSSIILLI